MPTPAKERMAQMRERQKALEGFLDVLLDMPFPDELSMRIDHGPGGPGRRYFQHREPSGGGQNQRLLSGAQHDSRPRAEICSREAISTLPANRTCDRGLQRRTEGTLVAVRAFDPDGAHFQ